MASSPLGILKWGLLALVALAIVAYYGTLSARGFSQDALVAASIAFAPKVLTALLLLLVGKAGIEFTSKAVDMVVKTAEFRPSAHRIWSMGVWIAVAICIVFVFVGDFSLIFISLGVGILAFAIAFSPPLLSLAGWLYVTSRGHYSVGDFIEVGGISGEVADVSLLTTTVWEFKPVEAGETGKFTAFPNSYSFTKPVSVFRKTDAHVWDEVGLSLPFGADCAKARELMLKACDQVLGTKKMAGNASEQRAKLEGLGLSRGIPGEPEVFVSLSGESAELRLRYLVGASQRHEVKSAISARILSLFGEEKSSLRHAEKAKKA